MKKIIVLFLFMATGLLAQVKTHTVTIANAADTSSATYVQNFLYGIGVSSDFNATNITVLVADSINGTYTPLYDISDDSNTSIYGVTAGRKYIMPPTTSYMLRGWIKLLYDSSADSEQTHTIYDGVY